MQVAKAITLLQTYTEYCIVHSNVKGRCAVGRGIEKNSCCELARIKLRLHINVFVRSRKRLFLPGL